MPAQDLQQITVGGGCFWCIEAVFNHIFGVEKVVSGYSGGSVPGAPSYREVSSGITGHAEVVQISFNPKLISDKELLVIFMTSHNPTILTRKGGGNGSQYRSVIFYHDAAQKKIAQKVLKTTAAKLDKAITTEINALTAFFEAEEYHQNYFEKNPNGGFCTGIIAPKLAKLKLLHPTKIKASDTVISALKMKN